MCNCIIQEPGIFTINGISHRNECEKCLFCHVNDWTLCSVPPEFQWQLGWFSKDGNDFSILDVTPALLFYPPLSLREKIQESAAAAVYLRIYDKESEIDRYKFPSRILKNDELGPWATVDYTDPKRVTRVVRVDPLRLRNHCQELAFEFACCSFPDTPRVYRTVRPGDGGALERFLSPSDALQRRERLVDVVIDATNLLRELVVIVARLTDEFHGIQEARQELDDLLMEKRKLRREEYDLIKKIERVSKNCEKARENLLERFFRIRQDENERDERELETTPLNIIVREKHIDAVRKSQRKRKRAAIFKDPRVVCYTRSFQTNAS